MRLLFRFLIPLSVILMVLSISSIKAQTVIYTQDFETSLGDWVAGGEGSSLELSAEQAFSGTQSAKLVKPATGLEINLQNDVYKDLQAGDVLTFHIYISAADLAGVNGAQIFWQNTDGWNWNSQWTNGSDLTADTWNTVEVTMPAFNLPLQRIGFQLLLQAGNEALTPALYVDDITVTHPSEDLIAHWKLDEASGTTVADELGTSDGTLVNGADAMWVAGWDGNAIDFSLMPGPQGAAIEVPDNNIVEFDGNESFTISMLIKADPISNTAEREILMKGAFGTDSSQNWYGRWYGMQFKGGEVRLAVDDNVTKTQLGVNVVGKWQDNEWQHLVGVRDRGIDSLKLYLNGEFIGGMDDATDGDIASTPLPMVMGLRYDGLAPLYGQLDDVRFYNYALDANEVKGLFDSYGGLPTPFIIIDAQKDWFYNDLTGPDDGYLQLKYYACNDNGAPYNNADLSAQMWSAWDDTWFYFYTEVRDDIIAGDGPNSYQSDGIEFKFDPKATSTTNSIVAPNLTILDTSDAGVVGWDNLNSIPDSLKMYAKRIFSGGYALEVALKWDAIVSGAEAVDVAVDSVFGLALNVHDNDTLHTREGSVMWAARMVDAVWNTTSYLGTVKFLPDHMLQFMAVNNITGETNPVPFDGTPFYINVDAQKDPVYNALLGPDDGYLQIRSFSHSDNGAPDNDADLSAHLWTFWDNDWLYLYEEVRDDIISMNQANAYQNDGLELKIDPQATDSVTNSIFGSINLTAQDSSTAGATVFENMNGIADSMKQFARRETTTGYALELAVRWPAITANGEYVSVGVDSVFGLGINDHDNDGNGRDASITWAAALLDHIWDTPKLLGRAIFLADNKFMLDPTNNMTGLHNDLPYDGSDVVGVEKENPSMPLVFSLKQNYPNPFNPVTTISYTIPSISKVHLTVYDILGREVAVLVNQEQSPGLYKVKFNANNFASGVYFYRIEAGSYVNTQKMMLLK